jgi:hypothetical protein
VATRHQRFALRDVTFDGVEMPGATVDRWQQGTDGPRWSARLVTRKGPAGDEGELAGRTLDGRLVSGHAVVADRQAGASGRSEVLVVFHGSGDLHGLDDPPS